MLWHRTYPIISFKFSELKKFYSVRLCQIGTLSSASRPQFYFIEIHNDSIILFLRNPTRQIINTRGSPNHSVILDSAFLWWYLKGGVKSQLVFHILRMLLRMTKIILSSSFNLCCHRLHCQNSDSTKNDRKIFPFSWKDWKHTLKATIILFVKSLIANSIFLKIHVICDICEYIFSIQFNLNKHKRRIHNIEEMTAVSYDNNI